MYKARHINATGRSQERTMVACENGSALISVLGAILWLSMLVGIYWSLLQLQVHYVKQDAHRLQAEYVAEAGIYMAVSRLEGDPLWEVSDSLFSLADSLPGTLTVEPFGAYHLVRATARTQEREVRLRTLVAAEPPPAFDNALYLWDHSARLNVAGTTSIYGPITTGRLGVRQNTLPGISYTGDHIGAVRYVENLAPPQFSDTLITRSLSRFDMLIDSPPLPSAIPAHEPVDKSLLMPSELPIYYSEVDIVITAADSLLFDAPHVLVTPGNIALEGAWRLPEGTILLAGNHVTIGGTGYGNRLLFYGRQGIQAIEHVRCNAQLFTRGSINISGAVHLTYPSVVFSSTQHDDEVSIEINGTARVDGIIMQAAPLSEELVRSSKPYRVVLSDSVEVRGALFNPYQTELKGTVHGSVITYQFYLYKKPSRYVNWVLDAEINHHLRPSTFHVPQGFVTSNNLDVIAWERALSLITRTDSLEVPADE